MNEISVSLVKELREKTGAGMMNCKKALVKSAGDLEGAIDWLRSSGLAAAAKKANRIAAEGLVAVKVSDSSGVVIEINAETDFVARNDEFKEFVNEVACLALTSGANSADLLTSLMDNGETVSDTINTLIAKIGENIKIRRVEFLKIKKGIICSYIHNSIAPGLGKIGVLVAIESEGEKAALEMFGRQIAMHIAATSPRWGSIKEVPENELEREKMILMEQAKISGKPEKIIEKMVEGRIGKFFSEFVLLEQISVIDNETKIFKAVEKAEFECGAPLKISGFQRFSLGEGLEKNSNDFASDVAATINN